MKDGSSLAARAVRFPSVIRTIKLGEWSNCRKTDIRYRVELPCERRTNCKAAIGIPCDVRVFNVSTTKYKLLVLFFFVLFFSFFLFSSHSNFFPHMETLTWDLKPANVTYIRHALSANELFCRTLDISVYMVISENPWQSHLLKHFWHWSFHYLILWLRSVTAGIRTHNIQHASFALNPLRHRCGQN